MTQKIVYLHRKDINNPGDWFSSPYHYFKDFEGEVYSLLTTGCIGCGCGLLESQQVKK